jgi:hypothetical protein
MHEYVEKLEANEKKFRKALLAPYTARPLPGRKAPTEDTLQALLRGDVYQQLKNAGPPDVYEQTRSLAMAKAAVLKTN